MQFRYYYYGITVTFIRRWTLPFFNAIVDDFFLLSACIIRIMQLYKQIGYCYVKLCVNILILILTSIFIKCLNFFIVGIFECVWRFNILVLQLCGREGTLSSCACSNVPNATLPKTRSEGRTSYRPQDITATSMTF